ncbi:MAG: type IX secretion system membrane protein PorP/SprF [Cyclobacteriaceae bacterium]|nr:type IX secretion system membrane protein PorP/SprF [Cyclobacteriaceae bacterium]
MRTTSHLSLTIRLFSVSLLLLTTTESIAQQKPQFTQYMFNTLVINPAYAGAEEALSLTFIDRHQWVGIENAPTTQTLSAHTLVRKKNVGLGLSVINDKIGVYQNLNALASFAYHIQTGKDSYLSMGLQAGFNNNRANYLSLQSSGGPIDPNLANSINETYFDFGFGLYFRSPRFHIGVSSPQFVPKQVALDPAVNIQIGGTHYFLFSKYRMSLSANWELEPSTLVKYIPTLPLSYDANLNFVYRRILTTGVSYRINESVDFLLRAQVTPQLQFGYAYDHPIAQATRLSSGSHELMVNYLFKYIRKNVSSPR